MSIDVQEAVDPEALSAVRALCRAFRTWLYERYPEDLELLERYYEPDAYEALLADLPVLHARPDGAILLATTDGAPCGCVMMSRLDDAACEMKRLFVDPAARGGGIGRALCEELLRIAAQRGYEVMRLDTGYRHHEAVSLYARLGFERCDAYWDLGIETAGRLIFMEKRLDAQGNADRSAYS